MNHAKDFLRYEVMAEELLEFLKDRKVISAIESNHLLSCSTRQMMTELLLDMVLAKGHDEFLILCQALREVSQQKYLADLLTVLDRIFEIVTSSADRKERRESGTHNPHAFDRINKMSVCEFCVSNNNLCEEVNECMDFDIEIKYCDIETRQIRPTPDVTEIKRTFQRSPSCSLDVSKDNVSLLTLSMVDYPERFVPVLAVNLYNQCLRAGGMRVLSDILRQFSCIRELSLAKNHLSDMEIRQLSYALQQNTGLVTLDIRLNNIGSDGSSHLAESLRRNCSLRTLNVTSTGLTGIGCSQLVKGLSRNVSLTELDIGFNEVHDSGCRAVAEVIGNNFNIKRLRMRDNGITWHGAQWLFRALKKNSRLVSLDLSSNNLGDDCTEIITEALLCNRTLRELNLEKCCLAKKVTYFLARALKTNTSLKYLDLSMNPLRDDGVDALSEGLKYNHNVETLCLNMCEIGNKGFMRLLQALHHNSSMSTLKLCFNKIGTSMPTNGHTVNTRDSIIPAIEEVYDTLCHILQLNKSLKVLLWGNILETESY